jgi:hypothetical protein
MKPGGRCSGIAHFSLPDGHLSTLHLKSLSVVAIIFQSFFFLGLAIVFFRERFVFVLFVVVLFLLVAVLSIEEDASKVRLSAASYSRVVNILLPGEEQKMEECIYFTQAGYGWCVSGYGCCVSGVGMLCRGI